MNLPHINPHHLMGIKSGAGLDATQINDAYRTQARKVHPDLNQNDPNATLNFKRLNAAKEILMDSSKRSLYDKYGHPGLRPGFVPPGANKTKNSNAHSNYHTRRSRANQRRPEYQSSSRQTAGVGASQGWWQANNAKSWQSNGQNSQPIQTDRSRSGYRQQGARSTNAFHINNGVWGTKQQPASVENYRDNNNDVDNQRNGLYNPGLNFSFSEQFNPFSYGFNPAQVQVRDESRVANFSPQDNDTSFGVKKNVDTGIGTKTGNLESIMKQLKLVRGIKVLGEEEIDGYTVIGLYKKSTNTLDVLFLDDRGEGEFAVMGYDRIHNVKKHFATSEYESTKPELTLVNIVERLKKDYNC